MDWKLQTELPISEDPHKIPTSFSPDIVTHSSKQKLHSWGNKKVSALLIGSFNNILFVYLFVSTFLTRPCFMFVGC